MDHHMADIPMRLSRKFEPFILEEEPLPELPPESWMQQVSAFGLVLF
jgi:hypothetical protein